MNRWYGCLARPVNETTELLLYAVMGLPMIETGNRCKGRPPMEVPNQIVVFGVGTTRYALDIEAVDEILAVPEIVPLAGAPNGVVGMVDVRGRVVPVFDLRWKFGVPETGLTDASRLVLVASARVPVALLVDGVEEVRTLRGDDLQSVQTPGVQGGLGYLRGVVGGGRNLILLVDHLALVPEAAVRSLKFAA